MPALPLLSYLARPVPSLTRAGSQPVIQFSPEAASEAEASIINQYWVTQSTFAWQTLRAPCVEILDATIPRLTVQSLAPPLAVLHNSGRCMQYSTRLGQPHPCNLDSLPRLDAGEATSIIDRHNRLNTLNRRCT